jgi:hypothetical protein
MVAGSMKSRTNVYLKGAGFVQYTAEGVARGMMFYFPI